MLASTITHGGIKWELAADGSVVIVRASTGETFMFSPSEIVYLLAILQIHGWPVAPLLATNGQTP